jgi:hypothetical protein
MMRRLQTPARRVDRNGFTLLILWFDLRHVCAEGRGGQAFLVEQVHFGHIRPAVAHRFWLGHALGSGASSVMRRT